MADYINSNILCQAYININRPMASAPDVLRLRESLSRFVESRSKFFLYESIDAKVEIKSGSIVEYLTVSGSLYLLFQGISSYPDFREGLILLYTDVKRLADSMILEALFTSRAKANEVTHTEARTGIIGSLKELTDNLASLSESIGRVRVKTLTKRLDHLSVDATTILNLLSDKRDIKIIAENLKAGVFALPLSINNPNQKRTMAEDVEAWRNAIAAFIANMDDHLRRP